MTTTSTARDPEFDKLLSHANTQRVRRDFAGAVDTCVEALRRKPNDPAAHALLGDIYMDQQRLDEAASWYRMAVDLQPDGPARGRLEAAEKALARGNAAAAAPTASLPGTQPLLGASPHRWLAALTIVSVAFVVLALGAMAWMHGRTPAAAGGRRLPSPGQPVHGYPPISAERTAPFPAPGGVQGAAAPAPQQQAASLPQAAPVQPVPPAHRLPPGAHDYTIPPGGARPDLPLAAVGRVQPTQKVDLPAAANLLYEAGVDRDPPTHTVHLRLTTRATDTTALDTRGSILREAFRIAVTELGKDSALTIAQVDVLPQDAQATDAIVTLQVTADNAARARPNDPEPALEGLCTSIQWAQEAAPAVPPRQDAGFNPP